MTGRYELIAAKLLAEGGARFQKIMDAYVRAHYPGVEYVSALGSHKTKNKSRTGTPDSIYWLTGGGMLLGEHTTVADGVQGKFKKDLIKCAAEVKEKGFERGTYEVVLCYNDEFTVPEIQNLKAFGKELKLEVSFIGLGDLATDVSLYYPEIAEEFLGIPYDTGQVMRPDYFIKYYDSRPGALATPLTNPFLERTTAGARVTEKLESGAIVMLSGKPGIGKTRFGVEFIKAREKTTGTPGFVIVENHQSVSIDLERIKSRRSRFTILIDDADRKKQLLTQVLNLMRRAGGEKIELVLTVRSIARLDLERELGDLNWVRYEMAGPSDDTIRRMIAESPYRIERESLQTRIVNVSHGSARFAMMLARLASDDPEALKGGLGRIYRAYYNRYIKDFGAMDTDIFVRVLGLLAYERAVVYSEDNKEMFDEQLAFAGVSRREFLSCVTELERRELVDRKQEHETVLLGDQNLRAYYFYRAFIEEGYLSFKELLRRNARGYDARLRNLVSNTSEDFGKEEVLKAFGPALRSQESLLTGPDLVRFYENFGFLWPENYLDHAWEIVDDLDLRVTSNFPAVKRKNGNTGYTDDSLLRLISKSFDEDVVHCMTGVEIAFRYIRKQSELLLPLIEALESKVLLDTEVIGDGYEKHRKLWNYLLAGVEEKDPLSERMVIEMTTVYFRRHASARILLEWERRESDKDYNQSLRSKIWDAFICLYDKYPIDILDRVDSLRYRRGVPKVEVMTIDRDKLVVLFSKKFSPERLPECLTVHDLNLWFTDRKFSNSDLRKAVKRFQTELTKTYWELEWKSGANKARRAGVDYSQIKRQELIGKYTMTTVEEFTVFLEDLALILPLPRAGSGRHHESVGLILALNRSANQVRGMKLLEMYLDQFNDYPIVMRRIIVEAMENGKEGGFSFLDFLVNWKDGILSKWVSFALLDLPKEYVDTTHRQYIIKLLKGSGKVVLRYDLFKTFSQNDEEFGELLSLFHEGVVEDRIEPDYFDLPALDSKELKENLQVVKGLYLLLRDVETIDLEKKLLRRIMDIDADFYVDYVIAMVSRGGFGAGSHHDNELGFIWEYESAELLVNRCMIFLDLDGSYNSPYERFFAGKYKGKMRAERFILDSISAHPSEHRKCNQLIDAGRNFLGLTDDSILASLLVTCNDVLVFRKFDWIITEDLISGGTNGALARLKQWDDLKEMVREYGSNNKTKAIRGFISNQIQFFRERVKYEERQIYIQEVW